MSYVNFLDEWRNRNVVFTEWKITRSSFKWESFEVGKRFWGVLKWERFWNGQVACWRFWSGKGFETVMACWRFWSGKGFETVRWLVGGFEVGKVLMDKDLKWGRKETKCFEVSYRPSHTVAQRSAMCCFDYERNEREVWAQWNVNTEAHAGRCLFHWAMLSYCITPCCQALPEVLKLKQ